MALVTSSAQIKVTKVKHTTGCCEGLAEGVQPGKHTCTAGALVLMLIVAHGGADRSVWHDVGTAMVEGVGTRIAVIEGINVIVVAIALAAAAVGINGTCGIVLAAVVVAAGVGMWGWQVGYLLLLSLLAA